MKHRSPSGFALVSTLAILVIVTILLVAFATVMRTERSASQNFADRSRAEAIATGMINRILAEHAAPVGDRDTGAPVKPFKVDSETGLPTQQASKDYFAAGWNATTGPDVPIDFDRDLLEPIYRMVPDDDDEFERSGLVRTSKPAGGSRNTDAYSREFWAYDGLTRKVLGSDDAMPATVPQWVDYYQPDDPSTSEDESEYPVAQVAFAIWDEGGKFDVNMVGEDDSVNGIAPHDLKIEETLTQDDGRRLIDYLDNQDSGNGERDRNNFSLRRIVSEFPAFQPPSGSGSRLLNDQGDDRWIFSVRELIERDLIDKARFRMVTTNSRDFDVRPEWDADRAPRELRRGSTLGAEDFLRSYINNPHLYRLIYGAGKAGPSLVQNTLNNEILSSRLSSEGGGLTDGTDENHANWMQIMRLLAVMRRSVPPYDNASGLVLTPGTAANFALNKWQPYDIWATAQNLIQASDVASDHNLAAYTPTASGLSFEDPNVRLGIRISPYIVEAAIKVKKIGTDEYEITNFIKLWNPFPFELTHNGVPIKYRVGLWTGRSWPNTDATGDFIPVEGLNDLNDEKSRAINITAPGPGQFKVVRFDRTEKTLDPAKFPWELPNGKVKSSAFTKSPNFRMRPYIQDMNYTRIFNRSRPRESSYLCIQMAPFQAAQYRQLVANISQLPGDGEAKWYSFQIDDPRMGSVTRDKYLQWRPPASSLPAFGDGYPSPTTFPEQKWSWILYKTQAMKGIPVVSGAVSTGGKEIDWGTDPDMDQLYDGKTFNVPGYNKNFGMNWPGKRDGVASGDMATFAKMMATFALPGRPFLNIGEIGTVFAYQPWTTLNFANKIIPAAAGEVDPPVLPADHNKALLRPAAILDYFTTIGTPNSIDFNNPKEDELRYFDPRAFDANPGATPDPLTADIRITKRLQDQSWLFESLKPSSTVDRQIPEGNLRPIRGRINLNTASTEVLTALLKAPYRMPASLGLQLSRNVTATTLNGGSIPDDGSYHGDYLVTIDKADAEAMAMAITGIDNSPPIRPLRMLSDLSQLYDHNEVLMRRLYDKYPQSVISAMIGRLAQFGTVRQQAYTIDMVVRTLNPAAERNGNRVITGEARLQSRVFFDSFSRQAFIESVEYK